MDHHQHLHTKIVPVLDATDLLTARRQGLTNTEVLKAKVIRAKSPRMKSQASVMTRPHPDDESSGANAASAAAAAASAAAAAATAAAAPPGAESAAAAKAAATAATAAAVAATNAANAAAVSAANVTYSPSGDGVTTSAYVEAERIQQVRHDEEERLAMQKDRMKGMFAGRGPPLPLPSLISEFLLIFPS